MKKKGHRSADADGEGEERREKRKKKKGGGVLMGGTPLSSDRSTRPSVGADETTGLGSAPTPTADAKRLDGGDDVTTANLLADWLARMSALASSRFFLFFCFTFLPFFFVFFFFKENERRNDKSTRKKKTASP